MSIVDPRITKQARILVDFSLKVKKGENIVVIGDIESLPLVNEVYKLLIKRGANEVRYYLRDYELEEIYYKHADEVQLKHYPKIEDYEMRNVDCYIRIGSTSNTRGLTGIDSQKLTLRSKTLKPLQDYRVEKTRWVVTRFPTNAQAQEADMSLSEYSDFVFDAINKVDWRKKYKEQEKLKNLVNKTKEVHVIGEETDLRFNIKDRNCVNAAGEYNMPDGEVFTSVVENSTTGYITFTYPAIEAGKEFHDVRLEFKKGRCIKASASKGENDLNRLLDTDQGSRRIGEFGIGNNFKIAHFSKDGLYDEKIGGTIHLALGFGYKETKSKNVSALHWDMIKDLRKGGELWFDDKLVQKNGKWLFKL